MITVALVVALLLVACKIAFHFGTIVGAERVRDGVRAVQEAAAFPVELPALEETTGVQCQGCLMAIQECKCPMATRLGSA